MDTGTDLGVYIPERYIRLSCKLPENYSLFQTELMAILKAVSIIECNFTVGQDITIYVDSQSAHLVKS